MSALSAIPRIPVAAVRGARDEALGIWAEGRTLAGRDTTADETTIDAAGAPSPQHVYLAWYGGLVGMAALRVIEWRLAAIIAAVHTVERYGHRRRVQEFAEGLGAGV